MLIDWPELFLYKLYADEDRSDDVRDLAGPLYVSASPGSK